MVDGYDPRQNPEGLSRFERVARIEKWLLRIVYAIVAVAFAYFIYGIKDRMDETDAIIEACGPQVTFDCAEPARAAYRQRR